MLTAALAISYAVLATLPAAMHVALSCGAPLGRFSVGGCFPGRLPVFWRVLALGQAALLAGMALVVLGRGGVIASPLPNWLYWPVAGITVSTCVANAASPSLPERRLWTPVTLGMVAAVSWIGLR